MAAGHSIRRSKSPPPEPGEVRHTQITIEVSNRPGALAEIGELLGDADVNIVTAAVFTTNERGIIQLVVEDSDAALVALSGAGLSVSDVQDVMAVTLEDQPGELGKFARSLSDAGINITGLYIAGERAGEKELIVAVDRMPTNTVR